MFVNHYRNIKRLKENENYGRYFHIDYLRTFQSVSYVLAFTCFQMLSWNFADVSNFDASLKFPVILLKP